MRARMHASAHLPDERCNRRDRHQIVREVLVPQHVLDDAQLHPALVEVNVAVCKCVHVPIAANRNPIVKRVDCP